MVIRSERTVHSGFVSFQMLEEEEKGQEIRGTVQPMGPNPSTHHGLTVRGVAHPTILLLELRSL